MSAATASVADVSRTDFKNKENSHVRKNTGNLPDQCTPMPLPALGTQRIIQGNGTNVGTVISLQCPDKHKLVGKDLMCVLNNTNPHWVGETYCKPISPYEEYGFRVAVLVSIISSGIILLMSVAFITCCLIDCIKEGERKRKARESDVWQLEEQEQLRNNRSRYSHKGRNNNNNNTQEKVFSLWGCGNPALCDSMQPCRCQHQFAHGSSCHNYGPAPPLSALPGLDNEQPLLLQNLEYCPTQYSGHRLSSHLTSNSLSISGSGVVWEYEDQPNRLKEANPTFTDETCLRNINSNRNIIPKELSIRIISV